MLFISSKKALFVIKIFYNFFFFTFWPGRKNNLIRNIWLISRFMTSQPGQRAIGTHIILKGMDTFSCFIIYVPTTLVHEWLYYCYCLFLSAYAFLVSYRLRWE